MRIASIKHFRAGAATLALGLAANLAVAQDASPPGPPATDPKTNQKPTEPGSPKGTTEVLPGVPAIDSFGVPTDFSGSANLKGAAELDLTGQGIYDTRLATTHLGILNSPDTWAATLQFLADKKGHH